MRFVIRWGLVAASVVLAALWLYTGFTWDERSPFANDWLVILVFVLMTLPFVFSQTTTPADREFRGGLFGIGTVVELRRTGTTVNGQPEMDIVMDIEAATGEVFRGTGRRVVDLSALSLLVPGSVLPVRYRPGRRDGMVMIDLDADEQQVADLVHEAAHARGELGPRGLQIYRDGTHATALILEMAPTGEIRDGSAVIDLLLRVTRPDGTTFDTRVEKEVQPVGIPGLQPGHIVAARYLPDDEQDVAIEMRVG